MHMRNTHGLWLPCRPCGQRRSPWDLGFDSRFFCRDFFRSCHTSDFKIGTPVATLPGACCYRISAGIGWPDISVLWLGKIESLICNLYLSVAACKLVRHSTLQGRERSVFNQANIGTVSRATLERLLRQGGARMGLSERFDAILSWNWNWTERYTTTLLGH